jgi:hypothetical protein
MEFNYLGKCDFFYPTGGGSKAAFTSELHQNADQLNHTWLARTRLSKKKRESRTEEQEKRATVCFILLVFPAMYYGQRLRSLGSAASACCAVKQEEKHCFHDERSKKAREECPP